jgi:ABC-type sugar transport system substrate-binding protein
MIKEGWIQATVVSQPVTMAQLAVKHAIDAAEKKPFQKIELTQASMITQSTVSSVDLSGQECK